MKWNSERKSNRSDSWLNLHHLTAVSNAQQRWWVLVAICIGMLMIIADTAAMSVALPTIKADLRFSDTSLIWVINAYLVTYAGFLLLGGRLGDIFGHRRPFLWGILIFTMASLGCALPQTATQLIVARFIQGLGGALVSTATLSLITSLFTAPKERTKAIGIYVFACSSGGILGVVLAGILTSLLSWRWIFLLNLPLGTLIYALCIHLLPHAPSTRAQRNIDLPGAAALTISLILIVYVIVDGDRAGWLSMQTLLLGGIALSALISFPLIESCVDEPLIPAGFFRSRNLLVCCVTNMLYSAAAAASAVFVSLYLQRILDFDPFEVGLAYLPWSCTTAVFALGLSARLVSRLGIKIPLTLGLVASIVAFILFARAPAHGTFGFHVLPGILLFGFSASVVYNPILVAATNSGMATETGLVSGMINTASVVGRILGLAGFSAAAAARTTNLSVMGESSLTALNNGYHLAFLLGAICTTAALCVALMLLRTE